MSGSNVSPTAVGVCIVLIILLVIARRRGGRK